MVWEGSLHVCVMYMKTTDIFNKFCQSARYWISIMYIVDFTEFESPFHRVFCRVTNTFILTQQYYLVNTLHLTL